MSCRACELEAEIGTEEIPHPIDPRVHECVEKKNLIVGIGDKIQVTDQNFMECVRLLRDLRKQRETLHRMSLRMPVFLDILERRYVVRSPAEVDELTNNFFKKIKIHWRS